MPEVYQCTKCGASVTVNGRPRHGHCSFGGSHNWEQIGELGPTASSEALDAFGTFVRATFEGVSDSNLSGGARMLIALPLLAVVGFVAYILISINSSPKSTTEEEPAPQENSRAYSEPAPAAVPATASQNETQPSSAPIGRHISESHTGRFGTVSVRYDVKTVQGYLYVNDILVPKDLLAVAPSIVQKWDIGAHEVYLLSDDTGGVGCPATYFFLNVQNGVASASENFGSCSDEPEIAVKNGEIIIHFMKFGTAPESTIRFVDGRAFSSEGSGAETHIPMTQVKL